MDDTIHIHRREAGGKGMFFVGKDGVVQAELIYHLAPDGNMVIEHTEVGNALAGMGVGRKLVEAAVAYARSAQIRIVPHCPYANALIHRTPAWKDILA